MKESGIVAYILFEMRLEHPDETCPFAETAVINELNRAVRVVVTIPLILPLSSWMRESLELPSELMKK